MIAERQLAPEQRPHAYVEGVRIKRGRDGRVYILCSACAMTANAVRHRGFGAIRRVRDQRVARKIDRHLSLVRPAPTPPEAPSPVAAPAPDVDPGTPHPFVASGAVLTDTRGRRRPLCDTCGRIQNARGRHLPGDSWYHRRRLAAAEVRAGAAPVAPIPRPAPTARPRTLPAAEYVALALDIDRLLALPADAIGWKLRVRLTAVRELLKVPDYPTLAAVDEPDPEAPPPSLVASSPEVYAPKPLAPAGPGPIPTGLLRGIQSGRHRDLVRRAHEQGWAVSMTGAGHVALSRGSTILNVSTTVREGRGRGWANLRAQARRAGIDVGGL